MKDNYIIKEESTKVTVRDLEIEFKEKFAVDIDTGEEIFIRELEIENDIKLYDIYKSEKGLLTSTEIKSIRAKYDINQNEFSKILGFGAITIHRYENGTIQTEANNSMIKLCEKTENMKELLISHGQSLNEDIYLKIYKKIEELTKLEKHKIIKEDLSVFSKNISIKTVSVLDITKNILLEVSKKKDHLTHLSLQKLSYYVQGLGLALFGQQVFKEDIINFEYGPVVREVYNYYKDYKDQVIPTPTTNIKLDNNIYDLIKLVVNNYGQLSAWSLVELTHGEEPWLNTKQNEVIPVEDIKRYFRKIYIN